ncbi:resistin-like [Eleutherodactylus coqui]|uniref:resistin-like n=1 Tax=Eleutherodactylus coqui TaxID=57060 RepID=UPI003462A59E
MAYLTLFVCSLLVISAYSQPPWGGNGGGNNKRCSCDLECVTTKSDGNIATCQSGYTAMSCSCGRSCSSHSIRGSNACFCQCGNVDWASARCCRTI